MTGIRREFLASQNFVMIHLSLVDYGLSWEAAALLHRIDYRSGGGGWWTVTKAGMQEDMRISERKLDRALNELRERGLLRAERASAETSLMRWGVRYLDSPPGRNVPQPSGTKRPDAGDETSRSSTKNNKKTTSSSSGDDGEGPSVGPADAAHADAQFEGWWLLVPRKVGKKAARKSYDKAAAEVGHDALLEGLLAHLPYWEGKTQEHIPHPSTWLNEGRWEDRPEAPAQDDSGEPEADPTEWMRRRSE